MKQQEELFVLIKSMNKNEKGYFRKFSGIHSNKGEGDYMKLFDCISAMDVYEEAAIKARFKGQKILSHLRVTKFYLKDMIVRALRNYYEMQVPYIRDRMELCEAFVLLKKGMVQAARKKILKEKQIAFAGQNVIVAMQWTGLYRSVLGAGANVAELNATAAQLLEEKSRMAAMYLEAATYEFLITRLSTAGMLSGKEQTKLLNEVRAHPQLSAGYMPVGHLGHTMRAELLTRLYRLLDEPEKGLNAARQMLDYCANPNNNYKPTPFNHFIMYVNLFRFLGRENTYEMRSIIEKEREIMNNHSDELSMLQRNAMFAITCCQEIKMHKFMNNPHEMLRVIKMERLHFSKNKFNNEEDELCNLVWEILALLELKEFNKALDCVNGLFIRKWNQRNDLLADVYLLNIIIHTELRNYAIIKRQVTMAKDFMKKTFPEAQIELKLITALAKAAKFISISNKARLNPIAAEISNLVQSQKIGRKEFIEEWIKLKAAG
jgi:hypothetical protein